MSLIGRRDSLQLTICFCPTSVIQVGLSAITYEVTESPNKEVGICVNIELGSLSSDATVRLLTPPSGASTGKLHVTPLTCVRGKVIDCVPSVIVVVVVTVDHEINFRHHSE